MTEWPPLTPCDKPDCDRQTTAAYCCPTCAAADRDGWEVAETGPLSHGDACDSRHAHRGPTPQPGRPPPRHVNTRSTDTPDS